MKAADLMSREPLRVPAGATANDVMVMMRVNDVRHLPVVDRADHVIGMISDHDLGELPRPVFAGAQPITGVHTPLDSPVEVFMSRKVFSATRDTDAGDVVDMMLNHRMGCVPVVDERNVLQGIITYTDVLKRCRNLV